MPFNRTINKTKIMLGLVITRTDSSWLWCSVFKHNFLFVFITDK
ncbi:MAG: hypothetical protein AVDCRST_MAG74-259 [uncultured Pyrinomonadaceae bacterium]|uniref:Uncharacterized protein n=1 Tax=uncultured Pyrinomonadaceae bacterium TaxID=2283094 RepID=A0A6J4NA79_9BACT|nr:MAG: hypothetical protein AVDCRST_MAG74-259 [uncultured Pyrinomonadaceae bacterium]